MKRSRLSRCSHKLPIIVVGGWEYIKDDKFNEFRKVIQTKSGLSTEVIPFSSDKGKWLKFQLSIRKSKWSQLRHMPRYWPRFWKLDTDDKK